MKALFRSTEVISQLGDSLSEVVEGDPMDIPDKDNSSDDVKAYFEEMKSILLQMRRVLLRLGLFFHAKDEEFAVDWFRSSLKLPLLNSDQLPKKEISSLEKDSFSELKAVAKFSPTQLQAFREAVLQVIDLKYLSQNLKLLPIISQNDGFISSDNVAEKVNSNVAVFEVPISVLHILNGVNTNFLFNVETWTVLPPPSLLSPSPHPSSSSSSDLSSSPYLSSYSSSCSS